ncbi:MAG: hypothetical protein U0168_05805 [Nannocystaceae bacterium]
MVFEPESTKNAKLVSLGSELPQSIDGAMPPTWPTSKLGSPTTTMA